MTNTVNRTSSGRPQRRSRYRQASGTVARENINYSSSACGIGFCVTSIQVISTKPEVRRVHGYFQLRLGVMTTQGRMSLKAGGDATLLDT